MDILNNQLADLQLDSFAVSHSFADSLNRFINNDFIGFNVAVTGDLFMLIGKFEDIQKIHNYICFQFPNQFWEFFQLHSYCITIEKKHHILLYDYIQYPETYQRHLGS